MKGLTDRKSCRENERLVGEDKAERVRSCRRQLLASFLASLMSFSSGTVVAGWTPAGRQRPGNDADLTRWSVEQESWIVSIYVFGALLGALPAGFLSHRYGRKSFLLWLALPMAVGWFVCLLRLNDLGLECLGRFLCGISLGATTVAVPLYASDVSSDVLRGRTGVFLDFMLCAGIQYAYVARTVLAGVRQFCLACAVVPLAFVALFSCAPESPVHLFDRGRYEQAAAALRWLRGQRFDVRNEFDRMERTRWNDGVDGESAGGKTTAENRRFLTRVLVVSFGLVLVQRLSGAGGVIQYSVTLFQLSGAAVDPDAACIVVGAFQLAASGASFLLVDRVGRRTLLLVSSAVVTACLVLLVVYFGLLETGKLLVVFWNGSGTSHSDLYYHGTLVGSPWKSSVLVILCVFITAFRLGLGPIPWFMGTELMSAERGRGGVQSAVASFSWFMSFAVVKSFKAFVERNPVALWCSFAAYSAAGFVFVLVFVPETNGKSREQIRAELVG